MPAILRLRKSWMSQLMDVSMSKIPSFSVAWNCGTANLIRSLRCMYATTASTESSSFLIVSVFVFLSNGRPICVIMIGLQATHPPNTQGKTCQLHSVLSTTQKLSKGFFYDGRDRSHSNLMERDP